MGSRLLTHASPCHCHYCAGNDEAKSGNPIYNAAHEILRRYVTRVYGVLAGVTAIPYCERRAFRKQHLINRSNSSNGNQKTQRG